MKNKNNTTTILLLIIIVVVAVNIYLITNNYRVIKSIEEGNKVNDREEYKQELILNTTTDPYSLDGYVPIEVNVAPQTVILSYNCTSLSLPLDDLQVFSIKNGLLKRIEIRPTVHDSFKALMDNYNITLQLVKITEIKDDVYLSSLVFRSGNKILNIDSKPSDSIAISLRTRNKIYMKKEIFDKQGKNSC